MKLHGTKKWAKAGRVIEGRSGKQCRERWINVLSPDVCRSNWTLEEDKKIFDMFHVHGAKWSWIAEEFPGRTENSVKNRFYTCKRKMIYQKRQEEESQSSNKTAKDPKTLNPVQVRR